MSIGIGQAQGENRAQNAMEDAVSSPLLDGRKLSDAPGLIIEFIAPPDFMMNELSAGMNVIKDVDTRRNDYVWVGL